MFNFMKENLMYFKSKKMSIKKRKKSFINSLVCVLLTITVNSSFAQYDANRFPIIPKPAQLIPTDGAFAINSQTIIFTENKSYGKEINVFRNQLQAIYGIAIQYGIAKTEKNFIYISQDSTGLPNEGYKLQIKYEGITIYGGQAGVLYALQSVFQLIRPSTGSMYAISPFSIPACTITDQPQFSWRGIHLDVSRHFFTKENIKDYLKYMALYKLNTFHWHLTDDQGWRIEIKKYPKLTSVGAWRNGTIIGHQGQAKPQFDTLHYGGFYTQLDILEIIKFADSLHITIVPEIEMPGHALAMLAAYPELGCTQKDYKVANTWGVFEDVLCPSEKTLSFLDDVLQEVCALFPGKYIHIGGDECPKESWEKSTYCQNLMKLNNLKDENELQSWFTKKIVTMLQKKGKQAIGWDEILEGGLADGAAVMSWRGEEGGIAAAKAKHNVVMSPGTYCYFDHYQSQNENEPLAIGGYLPLENVYAYNPIPSILKVEERKYILGLQANVWTEYIPDFKQVQYMLFPRIAAEAEVGWAENTTKDFDFFLKRLMPHFYLYDRMKINYSKSIFEVKATTARAENGINVTLSTLSPKGKILFTLEGKEINYNSTAYTDPILVTGNEIIKAAVFEGTIQKSNFYIQHFQSNLAFGKPVTLRKNPATAYNYGGSLTLVDGKTGRIPWLGSEWLGFSNDTLDATIDLGKEMEIHSIAISFLNDPNSWIYTPTSSLLLSSDGINFSSERCQKFTLSMSKNSIEQKKYECESKARYIKIIGTSYQSIPTGFPGKGNPAWLFISEIEVN